MTKDRKPLIRSAASLTNRTRELPPEAIAFAEQASHDQAERRAVASSVLAPAAAPNVAEMTKAKFFHLPSRLVSALKHEALARSEATGSRVTETALVIAALDAYFQGR